MRQCKRCKKWKDESQFYLKGHYVNHTYYTNYSGKCKYCECEVRKLIRMGLIKVEKRKKEKDKYMNWDNKLGGLTISDTQYLDKKRDTPREREYVHPDLWVVRNLRNYGNCYINTKNKHDLDFIEQQLGCKVRLRNNGILEVIKNV